MRTENRFMLGTIDEVSEETFVENRTGIYDVTCKKNGEPFDAGYGEYIIPIEGNETPIQVAMDKIINREVYNSPNATYFEEVYGVTDKDIKYLCKGKETQFKSCADTLIIGNDVYSNFDVREESEG